MRSLLIRTLSCLSPNSNSIRKISTGDKMRILWIILISVLVFSFAILGWIGIEIFRQAPPIPVRVVTTDGTVMVSENEILDGQNVWQAMGGMQVGSVWGHGSYVAP